MERSRLQRHTSDVSFKTVKRIFRNPYTGITVDTLNRLAKTLKVPITDLMVEEPDEDE